MKCDCGNQHAIRTRSWYEEGHVVTICNECMDFTPDTAPDVYLPRLGMKFQNLCDNMGNPIVIQSKKHKKEVMDKLGVRECPERLKGTPWIEGTRAYRSRQFEKDRPAIRETYRQYLDNVRRKS